MHDVPHRRIQLDELGAFRHFRVGVGQGQHSILGITHGACKHRACVLTVERETVMTATLAPNPLQVGAYGSCQHPGCIMAR